MLIAIGTVTWWMAGSPAFISLGLNYSRDAAILINQVITSAVAAQVILFQTDWVDLKDFLRDMEGDRAPGLSLWRIGDSGDPTADNCQWLSREELANYN